MQHHSQSSVPNPQSVAAVPSGASEAAAGAAGAPVASLASQLRAEYRTPIGDHAAASPRQSSGDEEAAEPPASKRFSTPWFVLGTTVLVVGFISLMSSLNYLPDINWVWVLLLLGMSGVSLTMGLNKVSFVLAGTFLAASVGSVLRQTGRISLNVEVPVLIMIAGALILVAMVCKLRTPGMFAMSNRVRG
jgi:hypothetical protein